MWTGTPGQPAMGGAGESAETETVNSEAIEPVGPNGCNGCRNGHRRFGLTGESEPRDRVHEWELDEPRGSRPVLGARGGEIPPRDSPSRPHV